MSGRFVSRLGVIAIIGGLLGVAAPSASGQCLANEIQKLTASDGALGDHFGVSVSILGDTAIVGAHWDNDAGGQSGSAYVFRLDPRSSSWVQQQKLTALDAQPTDEFGFPVAINPVDPTLIIVGARLDDDNGFNSGSAYVFRYNPDSQLWAQEQKITAWDGDANDRFGTGVSIWADVAMVGARLDDDPDPDTGSVYVFRYDPVTQTWQEQQKLIPSDWEFSGRFGTSVSLEGDWAVIGAPTHHEEASAEGAAYIFRFDPKMQRWEEQQKLQASDAAEFNLFGASVSLSGDTVLIGATFGDAPPLFNSGAAYIFQFNGKQWIEQQKLTASDGGFSDQFGGSVSLSGQTAIIGALLDDDYANGSGSAYIFTFDGTQWNEAAKLRYKEVQGVHAFGISVFTDGKHAVAGASFTTVDEQAEAGAAYIYGGLGDCNANGELDLCDIADGFSRDDNTNGIPDECEPPECPWDLDGNNDVGVGDLLSLLMQWGADPGGPPDFDGDGNVGVSDLLALLANWGPCP